MEKISYRNGDWSFTPITEEEFNKEVKGKELLKHSGSFVFAEGEATGHFHTIVAPKKEDLKIIKLSTGDYIFSIESESKVTHPEHSEKVDIKLPAQKYRLHQRREKDWMSLTVRRVID